MNSLKNISIHAFKLFLWIIFNRIMVIPLFISYMFITKKPGIMFQICLSVICLILGLLSVKILFNHYKKSLTLNNPMNFHTDLLNKDIKNWCKIIALTTVILLGRYIFETHVIFSGNSNTNNTDSLLGSYTIPFFILLTLFGPICEEITVRGIFFSYFAISNSIYNKFLLIFANGFLFMILHGSILDVNAIMYFITGIILSVVFVAFKNIKYSIFMHVALNLIEGIFNF
ncbi:CPBP family intramembrane glutamic endopeptidase [Apilactobacillus xinyiensis]|uniref:CPBP family intramembrane glutamic endopeptidase n=1 Tax=Apilactobacillus xinyiensis TaxID=2841032 RepID=UPI00200D7F47|nr:type II CAAX endopeptidase family protein [Apilactobacillus xinyiensis]MCL0330837.1 CPBP family intramembrane metalloprotease [Apilactobacillus xinyiensis]